MSRDYDRDRDRRDDRYSSKRESSSYGGDDHRRRRDEAQSELDKAKRRRVERESSKGGNQGGSERSAAEWEDKDNQFFRKQDLLAIQIRIKEGRAKPIDKIFKLIHKDEEYPVHQNAYKILKTLSAKEMSELLEVIPKYRELVPGGTDYWNATSVLLHHRIDKLSNPSKEEEVVSDDIKGIFEGKTYSELEEMEKQIKDNLDGEEAAIVPEYWDNVLKKLKIRKAKSKMSQLGQEGPAGGAAAAAVVYNEDDEVVEDDYVQAPLAVDPRKAALEKEAARLRARAQANTREDRVLNEDEMLKREAAIAMEENEELFQGEVKLNKTYPETRHKPKFFNRVETGYDWNRYNQTHYDEDNPPPKIVMGYKFNIFYPDMPPNAKTPTYKLLPAESPDYVLLTFIAGPPYEDVAFSVVRKEWEHSHKKGFKCTFERGILHLWFDFKKYRYRR